MGAPLRLGAFANPEFRLLFGSNSISFIGDQFTTVALPWLVLQLTHNPAQLGLVFALIALPRGGASCCSVVHLSIAYRRRAYCYCRGALTLCLRACSRRWFLLGSFSWMIYLLSVWIGLCGAFAYPAGSAILPQIVVADQLPIANSIMMGVGQVSLLIGPALAGLLISAGSAHAEVASAAHGTGLAFVVDAASFVFSVALLLGIRVANAGGSEARAGGVLSQVAEGIRALWADRQLRSMIGYLTLACLLAGPLQVGLPLFANERLRHGAAGLGWLMTATACGLLLGSFIASPVARLLRGRVGLLIFGADAVAGMALAGLSAMHSVLPSVALLVCIGSVGSIGQIALMTWVVPPLR